MRAAWATVEAPAPARAIRPRASARRTWLVAAGLAALIGGAALAALLARPRAPRAAAQLAGDPPTIDPAALGAPDESPDVEPLRVAVASDHLELVSGNVRLFLFESNPSDSIAGDAR
jgi:hypothetical protein